MDYTDVADYEWVGAHLVVSLGDSHALDFAEFDWSKVEDFEVTF